MKDDYEKLKNYAMNNKQNESIEKWFYIISPNTKNLTTLKTELEALKNKNWATILPWVREET